MLGRCIACQGLASVAHFQRRTPLNRQRTGRGTFIDNLLFYYTYSLNRMLNYPVFYASSSFRLTTSYSFDHRRLLFFADPVIALTASILGFHRIQSVRRGTTLPLFFLNIQTTVEDSMFAIAEQRSFGFVHRLIGNQPLNRGHKVDDFNLLGAA